MAAKKPGEFATPNDDYLRKPITQPVVDVENYEIRPHFLTLVRQNHFGDLPRRRRARSVAEISGTVSRKLSNTLSS
jgi:hypothetical protein